MEEFTFPSISPEIAFKPTPPCYLGGYTYHSAVLEGDRQLRFHEVNHPEAPPTTVLEEIWEAKSRPCANTKLLNMPMDMHPAEPMKKRFQTLIDCDAIPVNIVPMEHQKKEADKSYTTRFPPHLLDCSQKLGVHDIVYAPYHYGNGRILHIGQERGVFRHVHIAWNNANPGDAEGIRLYTCEFLIHHTMVRHPCRSNNQRTLTKEERNYRALIHQSPSYDSVVAVFLLQKATLIWWKIWLATSKLPVWHAYNMASRKALMEKRLGITDTIDNILVRRIE